MGTLQFHLLTYVSNGCLLVSCPLSEDEVESYIELSVRLNTTTFEPLMGLLLQSRGASKPHPSYSSSRPRRTVRCRYRTKPELFCLAAIISTTLSAAFAASLSLQGSLSPLLSLSTFQRRRRSTATQYACARVRGVNLTAYVPRKRPMVLYTARYVYTISYSLVTTSRHHKQLMVQPKIGKTSK